MANAWACPLLTRDQTRNHRANARDQRYWAILLFRVTPRYRSQDRAGALRPRPDPAPTRPPRGNRPRRRHEIARLSRHCLKGIGGGPSVNYAGSVRSRHRSNPDPPMTNGGAYIQPAGTGAFPHASFSPSHGRNGRLKGGHCGSFSGRRAVGPVRDSR